MLGVETKMKHEMCICLLQQMLQRGTIPFCLANWIYIFAMKICKKPFMERGLRLELYQLNACSVCHPYYTLLAFINRRYLLVLSHSISISVFLCSRSNIGWFDLIRGAYEIYSFYEPRRQTTKIIQTQQQFMWLARTKERLIKQLLILLYLAGVFIFMSEICVRKYARYYLVYFALDSNKIAILSLVSSLYLLMIYFFLDKYTLGGL